MKQYFAVLAVCAFVSSCGPSKEEYNILQQKLSAQEDENKSLIEKVDSFKKVLEINSEELIRYKFSPSKLLFKAKEAFKDRNRYILNDMYSQLSQYHPESPERNEVDVLICKLNQIEEKEKKEEQEKKLKAVKKLRKQFDEVSATTWYYNPYYRHYNNSNHTSIYIGHRTGSTWLRLRMSYCGDSWIFFKQAYLYYDGNTMEIPFDEYKDKKSDNGSWETWEWIDVPVTDEIYLFLQGFSKAKKAKMRLSGKYGHTHTLSTTEKKAIEDVLLGYDVLRMNP